MKIIWKRTEDLKAGEICGDDVFDPNSFVLLAHKSSILDSKTIQYLQRRDVEWVPVRVTEGEAKDSNIILELEEEYSKEAKAILAPDLPLIVSDEKYHESIARFETVTKTFVKTNSFQKDEIVNLSNELVNEVLKSNSSVFNFMTDIAPGFIIKHGINTAIIACVLAKALNKSRHLLFKLTKVSLLHDIGLIYAQEKKSLDYVEDIFQQYKPGELNRIKIHPVIGVKIINKVAPGFLVKDEEDALIEHHERYDGKGFPMGAKGEKINEISRLMAIPDAYDTLITKIKGKATMDPYMALKWIVSNSGILFDPSFVKAFVQITGIYPTGTHVRLSNGSKGMVISKGGKAIGRPVLLVNDEEVSLTEKKDLFITEVLDLD
ncbi:MAG: HD domain-containing phosphohydrolase [Thermotogota bacterium]|nr:HD domain-containing phosphohydrolase [Thermotogota bacterium]